MSYPAIVISGGSARETPAGRKLAAATTGINRRPTHRDVDDPTCCLMLASLA
jgi:hypothetical protein